MTAIRADQSIGKRAINGVAWSAIQQVATQLISAGTFFFLARLLLPSDFGVFTYASIALAFIGIFIEQGFADALVQAREVDERDYAVVFTAGLVASVLLGAGAYGCALYAENMLPLPGLSWVVLISAISLPLSALSSVQQAILRRQMQFRLLTFRQIAANLVGGVAGIGAAFAGWGPIALSVQLVASSAAAVVTLWALGGWRPRLGWDRACYQRHFRFAAPVYGAGVLDFFNRRADDFFIGIYLGSGILGLYNLAYRILLTGTRAINAPLNTVGFSLFSRLQDRRMDLHTAFFAGTKAAATLAFPLFGCLWGTAPWLIPGVLGEKWAAAVPVVQIFCVIGVIHSITFLHGAALRAVGRARWQMHFTLLGAALNLVGFFITARFGLIYVAASYVLSAVLLLPLDLWLLARATDISVRAYLVRFFKPAMLGLAVAVGSRLLTEWGNRLMSPASSSLSTCAVLGGLVLWFVIRPDLRELRQELTRLT